MALSTDLLETIACPLCSSWEGDIVRTSQYHAGITVEELKTLYSASYSASSAHVLMDQVVRCRSCSLVYVNPRPDPELILSSYSEAEDPTFVAQNGDRIKTFRRTIRRVLRGIGKTSGDGMRLLDIGCAGGAFLVAARDAGFEATGIEPSRWMADFGRSTYRLNIIDGILRPHMFPAGTFDIVTLWDVIEHVPDPHELLTLIYTLLKPGGWLVVNYPDIGTVAARMLGRRWPFWLSVHLLYYTRDTMQRQLKRACFEPKRLETFWQTLPLGYVVRRAAAYIRPLALLTPVLDALRLSGLACTYNMGQTLVISQRSGH
jgi:2-polyprenyl-3-methyl-5-hydroxy-6-metoxy-1,4-benzoquinol methylase